MGCKSMLNKIPLVITGLFRKLIWVSKTLIKKFNYPSTGFHVGTHTPYLIMQIPPFWQKKENAVDHYLNEVAQKTGVLFGRCFEADNDFPWIRVYLGAHTEIVETAFKRLLEEGFIWS